MNKYKNYYGIDISKDVFDVMDANGKHKQYANSLPGFEKFFKTMDKNSCAVMEATGVYQVQLANFLSSKKCFVSVVNPLVIKRFIQMNLRRIKTDKADAEMICKFAQQHELEQYKPAAIYVQECRIISEDIDLLIKSRTMFKNRLHAMKHKVANPRKILISSISRSIKNLTKEILLLEKELKRLIQKHDGDLYSRLQTIPGIGKSTAMFMIVLSDSFKKFDTAKQFTCFVGLSPVEKRSGSSIRGRSSISKQGNSKIRNLLFMCSFTASRYNKACRELYERIVAKGKSKKLALIAVANKLIKQAFAIAKSGLIYDEKFVSVKPSVEAN